MKKIIIGDIDKFEAEQKYNISFWKVYVSQGPVVEKNRYSLPEWVYLLEGSAVVKALECEFNLSPGKMIYFDPEVEYIWLVETYSKVVYTHKVT